MRQKIYTINDFDFKPHGIIGGAVQGMLKLPNNITVSIVGGGEMIFVILNEIFNNLCSILVIVL